MEVIFGDNSASNTCFFVTGLRPKFATVAAAKAFFLGLPNPQICFVFCFKVDLDLAEIQNHVLLKNASKNGITETIARFRAGKTGM